MHAPRPPHKAMLALLALMIATLAAFAGLTARARAAAVLDLNGQTAVVLTAEEFAALMAAHEAEIDRLRERLDRRRRVECLPL